MTETEPVTPKASFEAEQLASFEKRKQDHLRIAMDPRTQANGFAGFDFVDLIPEALPDLDFSEINLSTKLLGLDVSSPIFISSMTAGHENGEMINSRLAQLSHHRQILMGVGSQRRELSDSDAVQEWKKIRALSSKALLVGNLGIAQVIRSTTDQVQKLIDNLGAVGLFVHLNALQECIQPEGTPNFKGGLKAIENLVQNLSVPVIVKEVGCGMTAATQKRLSDVGVQVIDVSGLGGTHWGRIEGLRTSEDSRNYLAAQTFQNWGLSTVESLAQGREANLKSQLWASGGVRTGVDAAKLLAMGASAVGVAQPFLEAALQSSEVLNQKLDQLEYELKIALFCTGTRNLSELREKKVWTWTSK